MPPTVQIELKQLTSTAAAVYVSCGEASFSIPCYVMLGEQVVKDVAAVFEAAGAE